MTDESLHDPFPLFPAEEDLPALGVDPPAALAFERARYLDLLAAYNRLRFAFDVQSESLGIAQDGQEYQQGLYSATIESKDKQLDIQRAAINEHKQRVEYLKEVLRVIVNEV